MDPLDAVLSATVTLAQDLLSEKPLISRTMPSLLLTSPKAPRLGRRRIDQQSSDDEEESDLDLLVFAQKQKRRRNRLEQPSFPQMPPKDNSPGNHHDENSDSSSMTDPGVLYPKVSLHEPEVVVSSNGQQRNGGEHSRTTSSATRNLVEHSGAPPARRNSGEHYGATAIRNSDEHSRTTAINLNGLPNGSGNSPFMQYLRGCPDLTFETQFRLSRPTFSVSNYLISWNILYLNY